MTQPHANQTLHTWQTPECPFAIEYAPAVPEEIRQAAVDAFFSLPHGGAEIGGVLFGTSSQDGAGVRILAFRPIECEHARGPRFLLSANDLEQLQTLLRKSAGDPILRGLRVVGWYHTHTRGNIFLCPQDLAIYDRFFPEPRQIALVVRPDGIRPTRAGFFFRDSGGTVHAEATYREFVLAVPSTSTPKAVPAAPAPPPAPAAVPAPPSASMARYQRSRGVMAAACGALLLAGALTCVESVLAARMLAPHPAAQAVVVPALPPAPPPVLPPPPPQQEAPGDPSLETEPLPAPKAPPKPWAGLQPAVAHTDPPAIPQAPAPDVVAPAQASAIWAAPPLAAGPRRVAFEGGVITFFTESIVIADRKHPQGASLPAHGVEYTCESKSQSCTIAAGETRIRIKHATDYKMLMDYLTQTR